MAIDSRFVDERGPFLGTSCLPWTHRSERGVKAALAVNVDFTRGTIRPRPGVSKFVLTSDRFLGLSNYRKMSGESLVVGIVLGTNTDANTEHPWKLTFMAWDMTGTVIANVRLDTTPFYEVPDPDNWYCFAQYNNNLFCSSEKGSTLRYNFLEDPSKPQYATGRAEFKDLNNSITFPQGSIVITHEKSLVVAGFDGQTAHHLKNELTTAQIEIEDTVLFGTLQDQAIPGVTYVWFGDQQYSDVFVDDRLHGYPGSGAVKGLASTSEGVLVLCENGSWITQIAMSEDTSVGAGDFAFRVLAEGVGCVHQRSVVQGRGMTAWMAPDGIYMYDGREVQKISDEIEDLWSGRRWHESPIFGGGERASSLGYPFVIQQGRMDRACGAFDANRNCFMWAVPLSGYEDYNRLVLEYYVVTQSWSLHAPCPIASATGSTSFRPTNFASVYDRGKTRLLFSDYNTGIFGYNESPFDYDADLESDADILWYYQGAFHDFGPGNSASAKALQIKQQATATADPTVWMIESERNFDADNNELGDSGNTHTSPQKGPPNNATTVGHHWDQGTWGTTRWHRPGSWRARYPVAAINGNAMRVAFSSDLTGQSGLEAAEIRSYAIEVQSKRDLT